VPAIRRRQTRRRNASTALTTLLVAGPAGQAFAALPGASGKGKGDTASDARGAEGPTAGTFFKLGATGPAVAEIQNRLGIPADSAFGVQTKQAVRDFQQRNGLLADGVVGPLTWTKLMGLEQAAIAAGADRGDVAVVVRERNADSPPLASAATANVTSGSAVSRTADDAEPRHGGPSVGGGDAPADALEEDTGGAPDAGIPAAPTQPAPRPVSQRIGVCGPLSLRLPVKGTLTSPFGPRGGRNHDGIDISAITGTPIRAAECGVVSVSGPQGDYGKMVCVEHSSRFETCYAHMSRTAASQGQTVRKGQVIGYVGSTGRSTGPHVHLEARENGQAQDPTRYLRGGAVPGVPKIRTAANASASIGGPGVQSRAASTRKQSTSRTVRSAGVENTMAISGSGTANGSGGLAAPAATIASTPPRSQAVAPQASVALPATTTAPAPPAAPQPAARVAPPAPTPLRSNEAPAAVSPMEAAAPEQGAPLEAGDTAVLSEQQEQATPPEQPPAEDPVASAEDPAAVPVEPVERTTAAPSVETSAAPVPTESVDQPANETEQPALTDVPEIKTELIGTPDGSR